MEMNFDFWGNKTVLITGHTGFKGSWMSLWLQQLGANVVGYALGPPTVPSMFELAKVAEGMVSIESDIRDYPAVLAAVERHQPDIVFHMAAQPLVRESYLKPVETFETNVMGTVHLLEAVRQSKKRMAVVNVTTDKCYENKGWTRGYIESDRLGGHDPYSSSKACSELVTAAYRKSFFQSSVRPSNTVAVASARAGNVIGGGDWAKDRLIPDCIMAWVSAKTVKIRYPEAVRPWQFVLEPLGGYLLLAERLYQEGEVFAEEWNFGPDENSARPVRQVIETLAAAWGKQAAWEVDGAEHAHEANYLKLDCSKAKTKLGWHPCWGLPAALQKTAEWYRTYAARPEELRAITIEQIGQYMKEQQC
jgi:CDP-glucose 4,6-dehydratase